MDLGEGFVLFFCFYLVSFSGAYSRGVCLLMWYHGSIWIVLFRDFCIE